MHDTRPMKIGDLAGGVRGVSYRPEHLREDVGRDRTVLLRSTNIQGGHLHFDSIQIVPSYLVKSAQIVREGDLVVCMSNGSKALVGKAARYRGEYGFPLTIGAFCSVFHPRNPRDSSFLRHVFQGEEFRSRIDVILSGSAINNLKNGDVEGISVVRHAPGERAKIADILDAIDDAILETDELLGKLQSTRLGLIEDLVPIGLPSETLGSLNKPDEPFVRTGPFGTTMKGISWQETGVPVVPISALKVSRIDEDSLDYILPADAQRLKSFAVREHQILFSRVADVGRCAVIQAHQSGWIMSSNLMCLNLDTRKVNPAYVQCILSSHRHVGQLIAAKINAGGRDVMNSTILSSLKIPFLARADQDLFIQRIEPLDKRVDLERQKKEKYLRLREGLRADLLTGRKPVMAIREAAE